MFYSRQATSVRGVLFALVLLGSAPALADPLLFGAFASDQAQLSLFAGPLIDDQFGQAWSSGAEQPITSLSLESQFIDPGVQAGSGTFYLQDATPVVVSVSMFGYANASGFIADGALHEVANASAPDGQSCPTGSDGTVFFCTSSSAGASAYENWLDTLYVSGPANVPITLQITQHVSGYITNGQGGNYPTDAYDQLDIGPALGGIGYHSGDSFTDSGPVDWTVSDTLTVFAAETLTLEHQLILNTAVGFGSGSVAASLAFGDTANSFIDVLTPGASIVSASGLDYSTPTANTAPTPSTLTLFLAAALALLAAKIVTQKRAGAIEHCAQRLLV